MRFRKFWFRHQWTDARFLCFHVAVTSKTETAGISNDITPFACPFLFGKSVSIRVLPRFISSNKNVFTSSRRTNFCAHVDKFNRDYPFPSSRLFCIGHVKICKIIGWIYRAICVCNIINSSLIAFTMVTLQQVKYESDLGSHITCASGPNQK